MAAAVRQRRAPSPLLITADGGARYLDTPHHLLLGAGLDVSRSAEVLALPAGSTLLLYTDGLVEHRNHSITDGMSRLRTFAARPVEPFCDALLSQLAADPADDICLLALRVPPATT